MANPEAEAARIARGAARAVERDRARVSAPSVSAPVLAPPLTAALGAEPQPQRGRGRPAASRETAGPPIFVAKPTGDTRALAYSITVHPEALNPKHSNPKPETRNPEP